MSNGSNKHYYVGNREHCRFPWTARSLSDDVMLMCEIESECRTTVRQALARESGYTGYSMFGVLYELYGFDFLLDFLFDVMHNIPMNVGKRHLDWLVENDIVDAEEVDRRIRNILLSSGIVMRVFWLAIFSFSIRTKLRSRTDSFAAYLKKVKTQFQFSGIVGYY